MKRFTFFIEEQDNQIYAIKYYKIHYHGRDVNHAYNRAEVFMNDNFSKGLDYGYKLLTLNQYNQLKNNGSWKDIFPKQMTYLPVWLVYVVLAGTAKLVQRIASRHYVKGNDVINKKEVWTCFHQYDNIIGIHKRLRFYIEDNGTQYLNYFIAHLSHDIYKRKGIKGHNARQQIRNNLKDLSVKMINQVEENR